MRIPVNQLKPGMVLRTRMAIPPSAIHHLQHRSECDSIGAGLTSGAELEVAEVCARPGDTWVRLVIPGSDPRSHLKLTGGELAHRFDVA